MTGQALALWVSGVNSMLKYIVGIVLIGTALFLATGRASSQDQNTSSHPLVGSWSVTSAEVHGSELPALVTFHSDGTVTATDSAGVTWHGAWRVTGERSGDFTYSSIGADGTLEHGSSYYNVVEVDNSGNRFAAPPDMPNGGVTGERIQVEDMSGGNDEAIPSVELTSFSTVEANLPTQAP
jgi:hypothetical protein